MCKVTEWPVSDKGLLYDREWLVMSESGVTLNQKQETKLCFISPSIDLRDGSLTLSAAGMVYIYVYYIQLHLYLFIKSFDCYSHSPVLTVCG